MHDGDEAGLAHFADSACMLAIVQNAGNRRLLFHTPGESSFGAPLNSFKIWLRSTWRYDGQSQFAYSLDGVHFRDIGLPYGLTWGNYRGDRVGLFTFNNSGDGGFVDVDRFDYTVQR